MKTAMLGLLGLLCLVPTVRGACDDCNRDQWCDPSADACMQRGELDASCDHKYSTGVWNEQDPHCMDGLSCYYKTCASTPPTLGEPCADECHISLCDPGSKICIERPSSGGAPVAQKQIGEACTFDNECQHGGPRQHQRVYCSKEPKICTARVAGGEACLADNHCRTEEYEAGYLGGPRPDSYRRVCLPHTQKCSPPVGENEQCDLPQSAGRADDHCLRPESSDLSARCVSQELAGDEAAETTRVACKRAGNEKELCDKQMEDARATAMVSHGEHTVCLHSKYVPPPGCKNTGATGGKCSNECECAEREGKGAWCEGGTAGSWMEENPQQGACKLPYEIGERGCAGNRQCVGGDPKGRPGELPEALCVAGLCISIKTGGETCVAVPDAEEPDTDKTEGEDYHSQCHQGWCADSTCKPSKEGDLCDGDWQCGFDARVAGRFLHFKAGVLHCGGGPSGKDECVPACWPAWQPRFDFESKAMTMEESKWGLTVQCFGETDQLKISGQCVGGHINGGKDSHLSQAGSCAPLGQAGDACSAELFCEKQLGGGTKFAHGSGGWYEQFRFGGHKTAGYHACVDSGAAESNFHCVTIKSDGEKCEGNPEVESFALQCPGGYCDAANGHQCTHHDVCEKDRECGYFNICADARPGQPGTCMPACDKHRRSWNINCDEDLFCEDGVCRGTEGVGGSCTQDEGCITGTYCDMGADGDPRQDASAPPSNKCTEGLKLGVMGQPQCSRDRQCAGFIPPEDPDYDDTEPQVTCTFTSGCMADGFSWEGFLMDHLKLAAVILLCCCCGVLCCIGAACKMCCCGSGKKSDTLDLKTTEMTGDTLDHETTEMTGV